MNAIRIKLSEIESNAGQIKGLPSNPRRWDKEGLQRLAKSLQETPELLEARGILVYPHAGHYIAIGGNMRLEALRMIGAEDAPCVVIDEGTRIEKLKELVLKDNSAFGEWDTLQLQADWSDLPLEDWGVVSWDDITPPEAEEAELDEDDGVDIDEVTEADTRPGDIFGADGHYLVCGDSTEAATYEGLARIVGMQMQAKLLLTDPPYNVDYTGGDANKRERLANDNMSVSAFTAFLTSAYEHADKWLVAGAPIYTWMASMSRTEFVQAFRAMTDWHHSQELVWVKNTFMLGHADYQWQHEACLYGWKTGSVHYFTGNRGKSNVVVDEEAGAHRNPRSMRKDELVRYCEQLQEMVASVPTDVIRAPKPLRSEDHPTTKPLKLFGRCISNSSRPGDTVLDIFAGSGTTMIASARLGRKSISIEMSPVYCDAIRRRYMQDFGVEMEHVGNYLG